METQPDESTNQPVSVAVVEAIAAATDRSPLEVEPLYDTIDPEALNELFNNVGSQSRARGRITFVHCGYEVTVEDTGDVTVDER
ncbi:HalOD1 output domain-containing protein [Haloterrigena turkmenica]|uniref:HalOD1 output domain-containing protein n=1 Tax=Haloterrigena turkmenica TaxID=62320 RepID=UPI0009D713F3|nr:HalOD1 output domain-containing protein [Haloterrigena turkmenica]